MNTVFFLQLWLTLKMDWKSQNYRYRADIKHNYYHVYMRLMCQTGIMGYERNFF